jgi:hypothetical protein
MNNTTYEFQNTGYKLHLPVVDDRNDPLTKEVLAFLDKRFKLDPAKRVEKTEGRSRGFYARGYKMGACSDALKDGKGITVYGEQHSLEEMKALARDIEWEFGTRLEENIKKHGIRPTTDDLPMTKNVSYRFAAYRHSTPYVDTSGKTVIGEVLEDYRDSRFKSTALERCVFKAPDGKRHCSTALNPKLLMPFKEGDSMLQMLDSFGELFTGKMQNGKIPQHVLDGFSAEYLKAYPNLLKELPARIQKGTSQIVANMLEDIALKGAGTLKAIETGKVESPLSSLFRANTTPWLTTLEPSVIDNAKKTLAHYDPAKVEALEKLLPWLKSKCPAFAVLEKTTPLAKMNKHEIARIAKGEIYPKNPAIPATISLPKSPTPKPNVTKDITKNGIFQQHGGKLAAAALVISAVTYAAYALFSEKSENKSISEKKYLDNIMQPKKNSVISVLSKPAAGQLDTRTFKGLEKTPRQQWLPQNNLPGLAVL